MTLEEAHDDLNELDRLAEIQVELRHLYQDVDQAVSDLGPACALSGRCCRFHEYGHTLFLSAAEAVLLANQAPRPARDLDAGESCPWQDAHGRCTAREARPLGCRIYFCDPLYEEHASTLSERFLKRLKLLADERDWPWQYAPLHDHLHAARAIGRLDIALASGCPTS
jgi:Fe-S-cluster containining protein